VASAPAALLTLAARTGVGHPEQVLPATFMFAVIYLAIGALIGARVTSPVNGTVLILFVWFTDVMFGPVFGSPARPAGRVFPTHFLTLQENGRQVTKVVSLAFGAGIHPAFMAPMAMTALATLVGMFVILDSRAADRRLVLAGQRPAPLLAGRLALITLAALLATGVSLAVAATVATVEEWGSYITASVLLALTYALIGVILAPLFGRVAGVLVAFLVPFLDLGIAQDPMLHASPPGWAHFLPGYGGFRVLTDAVLTHGPAPCGPLLSALTWLAGAGVAAGLLFGRNMRTAPWLRPLRS
jgi:hypothetical protein